jgi:glutamyl-tRNA reductase
MNPQLFYMGITHRGAPLTIRERVRPDPAQQLVMLTQFADLAAERMILCTCERFELYALTTNPNMFAWVGRLASALPFQPNLLEKHAALTHGQPVGRQLLRVAAGLDSRILGEPQILRQVREAYSRARGAHSLGPILSALARAALHTGKRVRRETTLGRGHRSIVTATIDRAEQELGSLHRRTVLIVGTGHLASGLAHALVARKPNLVVVAGRDPRRASALARKVQGEGTGMDRLAEVVNRADVIVTCTAARSHVLTPLLFQGLPQKARIIIDLGVPRNADPSIGDIVGIRLIHMDELLADEPGHRAGVDSAETIVEEELARFERWHRERQVAATIASFVGQARAAKATLTREERRTLHARIMGLKQGVTA